MRKKRILSLVLVLTMMLKIVLPAELLVYAVPVGLSFDISQGDITVSAGTDADTIKVAYGAAQELDNILKTQEITITGTTTANKVVVDGVTANITIDGVNIQHSSGDVSAFKLINGSNVTLTLVGNNILKSSTGTSDRGYAGLGVGTGQTITITGTGSLDVAGGIRGAGIGGGSQGHGGMVTISDGEVTATGGIGGAGIGRAILGVGVFFIVVFLGEAVFFLTSTAFGLYEGLGDYHFAADTTVISVLLLFVIGYSLFFRKKASSLDDINLAAVYVGATILFIIVFMFSMWDSQFRDQQIPLQLGIFTMSLLVFSILILFFTSSHLSIKKSENVRLIKDVETIKKLNEQLEAEIEERKKLDEQLQYYATTDTLTGVLNRRTGMLLLKKQ